VERGKLAELLEPSSHFLVDERRLAELGAAVDDAVRDRSDIGRRRSERIEGLRGSVLRNE
jgi:hypothetical protein